MATWQFSIVLIPQSWATQHQYDASLLYDGEFYDTDPAWKDRQPGSNFRDILTTILPVADSWNKDLLYWGNTEEHDIQVGYENNIIEGIHIRLDLNQNLESIIGEVVKAANKLNCAFFYPELKNISEANETELRGALKKSNAVKFVSDPKSFLD